MKKYVVRLEADRGKHPRERARDLHDVKAILGCDRDGDHLADSGEPGTFQNGGEFDDALEIL